MLGALHYVAIEDPANKEVPSSMLWNAVKYLGRTAQSIIDYDYNYVKIAGMSGLAAVLVGALGNDRVESREMGSETKAVFETANRYHFYHSLAILAAPMSKQPFVTGGLMVVGTFLFSGALYYRAYTGEVQFENLVPIGGFCLMAAWISLIF